MKKPIFKQPKFPIRNDFLTWNYHIVFYCPVCDELTCFKHTRFKRKVTCYICESTFEGYIFYRLLETAREDKGFSKWVFEKMLSSMGYWEKPYVSPLTKKS